MKYTLHRALTLKKTTADRIVKEINGATFIAVRQGKKNTINGVPVEKVEQDILSSYQKIEQLISNYWLLKKGILRANAGISEDTPVKKVKIEGCNLGQEFTIAELIAASDELYGNRKHSDAFLAKQLKAMKNAYLDAVNKIERQHERVENNIRDYLAKAATSDKGLSAEEIKQRSDMFHADGDFSLVDPLNLKSKIDELSAQIENFRASADATLSEQNALTAIDVNLTGESTTETAKE